MKIIDYIGLALLLGQFFIYQYYYVRISDNQFGKTRESIITHYRWSWLNYILDTENPLLGIQTIRNLEMVHTFLITLTMIMMGAISSVFSANLHWINDIENGTYLNFIKNHVLVIKLLVAMGFLMMALFHFLFGLRICFNMNFTVAGSKKTCSLQMKQFIGNQVKRQARHFIVGVRALYYTLFPLIWVINVWAMIGLSFFITYLFYRFDYGKVPDVGLPDIDENAS